MSDTIPIATLHPFEPIPADAVIRAEVSLLWPYSSSHASCALLLVDPDFRQRHARGEIRVRFEGAVAQRLAKAHVGIGDQVRLELQGGRWRTSDQRALSLTPGKPIEAELLFDRRLHLTVLEDSSGALEGRVVHVDESAEPTWPMKEVYNVPSTPVTTRRATGVLGLGTPILGGNGSPALMKRLRLSQGHFLTSPGLIKNQHTAEDSGARKRRKMSGESVTKWTLLKTKPSSLGIENDQDDEGNESPEGDTRGHIALIADHVEQDPSTVEDLEGVAAASSGRGTRETSMAPPPLPHLQMPLPFTPDGLRMSKHGPLTPRLIPVSPGSLQVPSPFPQTPLSVVEAVNQAFGMSAKTLGLDNKPGSTSLPGYFDMRNPSDDVFGGINTASTNRQVTSSGPVKGVLRRSDLIDSVEDSHQSLQSRSEADISINERLSIQTVERPQLDDMAPPERSLKPINGDLRNVSEALSSAISEMESTTKVFGGSNTDKSEDEEVPLSGRNTPSDDQSEDLEPELLRDGIFALETMSSQVPSSLASPAILPHASDPGAVVVEVVPSKLPVLNDHHPFGLDGSPHALEKLATALGRGSADDEDTNSDGHSSQDEDAAWTAMDNAIHVLQDNSHETQQAPGLPLASIIGPEQWSPVEPRPIAMELVNHEQAKQSNDQVVDAAWSVHPVLHEVKPQSLSEVREISQGPSEVPIGVFPSEKTVQTELTDQLEHRPLSRVSQTQEDAALNSLSINNDHNAEEEPATEKDKPDKVVDHLPNEDLPKSKVNTEPAIMEKTEVDSPQETLKSKQEIAPDSEENARAVSVQQSAKGKSVLIGKPRRRPSSRLSLVPSSVDTWFTSTSPTSAKPTSTSRRKTIHNLASAQVDDAEPPVSTHADPSPTTAPQPKPAKGTRTDLTYLTPLASLETHLNSPSTTIDVLAVVSQASSAPVRARTGPRDWYTALRVTAPDVPGADVRVEIFRPWKESLPTAAAGDVVLLRAFGVRSKERQGFLLSGAESGWCVFRGEEDEEEEEVKGPPVERGEVERRLVGELRAWWEVGKKRGKGKGRATL